MAAVVSASAGARAESGPASNVVLSGAAGLARFAQGEQAPPLCCAERENWVAIGGYLRLGAGYRVLSWLEPGLDISAAYLRGSDGQDGARKLELSLSTIGAAPRVEFRFGDPLFFVPKLAWHFEQVSGEFVESTSAGATFEKSKSRLFTGPGLGIAIGYWVLPTLGIGGDAQGAFFGPDFSTILRIGATVSWVP